MKLINNTKLITLLFISSFFISIFIINPVFANSDFATSPVNYRLLETSYDHLPEQLDEQMLWVYVAVPWHIAEPCDSAKRNCPYNWNDPAMVEVEDAIDQYIAAGKKVFITIKTTPEWARDPLCITAGAPTCRPKQSAWDNFERFAIALYERHPLIFGLEVWNEPDAPAFETYYGGWANPGDPTYGGVWYGEFLADIYPTIKAAFGPNRFIYIGGLAQTNVVTHPSMQFFSGVMQTIKNRSACINVIGSNYDLCADGMLMHMYPYWKCLDATCTGLDWDVARGQLMQLGNEGMIKGKIMFNKQIISDNCSTEDCVNKFPIKINETALIKNDASCDQPHYAEYKLAKIKFLPKLYFRALVNLVGNTPSIAYFDYEDSWQCVGLKYNNETEPFEVYDFLSEKLYNYSWKLDSYVFGAGNNTEVVKLRDEYQPNIQFWAVYNNSSTVMSCFDIPVANSVTVYDVFGIIMTPRVDFCNPVPGVWNRVTLYDSPVYFSITN